jgi:hypothetical protein
MSEGCCIVILTTKGELMYYEDEMTPEQIQAEWEDFLSWQEEMAAEEAALTPEQKEYLRQAENRQIQEEAIGEMYASQYAHD